MQIWSPDANLISRKLEFEICQMDNSLIAVSAIRCKKTWENTQGHERKCKSRGRRGDAPPSRFFENLSLTASHINMSDRLDLAEGCSNWWKSWWKEQISNSSEVRTAQLSNTIFDMVWQQQQQPPYSSFWYRNYMVVWQWKSKLSIWPCGTSVG